jgi:predicted RNase H-like HicB family nuclease
MENYKIVIMYDTEYKGYVVDVPELPGCMSQGKTVDSAMKNVKEAIKGWLEAEEKKGKRKKTRISSILVGEVAV